MTTLSRGANTVLGPSSMNGLVVGARWRVDSVDCDLVALVCDEDRKVLGDGHMVFFNNVVSPERAVFLRHLAMGVPTDGDRGQFQVHLAQLPDRAHQVIVALAALEPGVSLTSVSGIEVAAFDPASGRVLASYEVGPEKAGTACLILVELYRRGSEWKIRAVGQGYETGLRGLSEDYGVSISD
ncbi:TerD family protein [Nocardioides sp. URHA0032]|uniref:TerD family protein n=1 Tax=Nocardioides sp. URHA0032 TaxID=1380388 RepID=UPI0004900523|nr:TerD family protein [Nocardioides sp. URHA0032]